MIDNTSENISDIDPRMTSGAVSIYGSEPSTDEFPVLKAFQQYIDAEQAKSRKRMMLLCVFFSFLMLLTIGVFVVLLIASSSRNQTLNDRLVEFAMKERDRVSATQQSLQPHQNDSLIDKLTSKLESLQNALTEERSRSEKAATDAARAKQTTAEKMEIKRLEALLAAEREKSAEARAKQREAELEEYRRKHYPELYGLNPATSPSPVRKDGWRSAKSAEEEDVDREIESIINDVKAVRYFDEESDEEESDAPPPSASRRTNPSKAEKTRHDESLAVEQPSPTAEKTVPQEVKVTSESSWKIPEE